jgi:uncharacterized OsmC-like protein
MADVQDPDNLKQLLRHQFLGEAGYWIDPQSVTVTVQGSDEEKTNFRLEDSLFDFTGDVSVDMLNKVVQQAYAQDNAEPDRFTYRYVEEIRITIEGYDISVTGKLAANDQVINDYYDFDFKGNLLD